MMTLIAFSLIIIGIFGIFSAISMFAVLVFHRLQVLIGKFKRIEHPVQYYSTLLKTLSLFLLFLISIILFLSGGIIQTFHVFLSDKKIGEISCLSKLKENQFSLKLVHYTPSDTISQNFILYGDQFVLEADFVRWNHLVKFFGVKNLYRLSRVGGRFINTDTQNKIRPNSFSLVKMENHPLWRFLYYFGYRIPGINSVYGSGVYQRLEPHKTYNILLTPSGLGLVNKNQ